MIKLLSIILSISIIITSLPKSSHGDIHLSSPSVRDLIEDLIKDEFKVIKKDKLSAVVRKGAIEHIICGVSHTGPYSQDAIEQLSSDRDVIIHEGSRGFSKTSFSERILNIADHILSILLFSTKSPSQEKHEDNMLKKDKFLLNIDIYFIKSDPLYPLVLIKNSIILSLIISSICILLSSLFLKTELLYLLISFVVHIVALLINFIYFYKIDCAIKIHSDFRNLIFATKLSSLNNILSTDNLKTIYITGKIHKSGTINYLLSDSLRQKAWQKWAYSSRLRKVLIRKLDILKSMEIGKLELDEENDIIYNTIGTIANLPGPRELLDALHIPQSARNIETNYVPVFETSRSH